MSVYIYIFIIFVIIFLWLTRNRQKIENFEDMLEADDTYEDDIYDKEFVDFYEIIYRDYSDIDHDLNIISPKIIDNIKNKDDISILVAGCGVGKLCSKLKEKYKTVIGVDISENILKKSQQLYPNIKFIRGNLNNKKLFEKNNFSHIFIDERTLYYNEYKEMEKIIINSHYWIKDRGFLIIPIYDPKKLQLAARYYSSKYMDNKGNIHGFTYLNNFSHDCYYIKNTENESDEFYYYDKLILDDGKKRVKRTKFYIPSKEKIYDLVLNNGFEIIHIEPIRVQIVGGYELALFRKKSTKMLVADIEKNIKI